MRRAFAASLFLLIASSASGQVATTSRLRFVAGASTLPAWVDVKVAADVVTVTQVRHPEVCLVTIPAVALHKVVYTPTRYSRGEAFNAGGLATSGEPIGVGAYNIAYLTVAAIATGLHGYRHYVNLEWEDAGVDQQLLLEVPKEVAPQFAEALAQFAGPKWMNLEQRGAKLMARIRVLQASSFPVAFGSDVLAGGFRLAAGEYRAIALPQSGTTAELCLFQGDSLEPERLKAIVAANVVPHAMHSSSFLAAAIIGPDGRLVEIRTPTHLVRVQ